MQYMHYIQYMPDMRYMCYTQCIHYIGGTFDMGSSRTRDGYRCKRQRARRAPLKANREKLGVLSPQPSQNDCARMRLQIAGDLAPEPRAT